MPFVPALFFIAFLVWHGVLGWALHHERPRLDILPPLPSDLTVKALSFGDAQFLYRRFAMELQNAGDTGGRSTPMQQYAMPDVMPWLGVLQGLDPRASHHTFLALRYFSQQKSTDDLRILIDFIDEDVALAPERKWYWQTQVVAMARDMVKDKVYALGLSRKLTAYADYIPEGFMWALQLEPILLEDLGRPDEARAVMERIVRDYGARMTEPEQNWTKSFFERLN